MLNNPKNRQQWILDSLKKDDLSFSDCFSQYLAKFSKSEVTFSKDWKKVNETYTNYRIKADKAKEDAMIKDELKDLKNSIKTRTQRLKFYQDEIEIMLKQLRGEIEAYFIVGNKPAKNPTQKGEKILPLNEQNNLRKVIREYQTEISKMEGDYAPTKTEGTLDVNDVTPPKTIVNIK